MLRMTLLILSMFCSVFFLFPVAWDFAEIWSLLSSFFFSVSSLFSTFPEKSALFEYENADKLQHRPIKTFPAFLTSSCPGLSLTTLRTFNLFLALPYSFIFSTSSELVLMWCFPNCLKKLVKKFRFCTFFWGGEEDHHSPKSALIPI